MTPDDEDIQPIAERIVELLREQRPPGTSATGMLVAERPGLPLSGLVDAATLARMLGVDRSWVYAHAGQLGGIRLGGPQGRLRFDLATLGSRLAAIPAGPPAPTPAGRRRPQSREA